MGKVVSIIGIDISKRYFQLHGVCAGIPIEDRYFMVFNLFYDASSQETVEPDPLVLSTSPY